MDGKTSLTFGDITVTSVSEAKARGYTFTQLKVGDGTCILIHQRPATESVRQDVVLMA